MPPTPDEFRDILGFQQTGYGHREQPEDRKFIQQTYFTLYIAGLGFSLTVRSVRRLQFRNSGCSVSRAQLPV
jgi:hypothetical protein